MFETPRAEKLLIIVRSYSEGGNDRCLKGGQAQIVRTLSRVQIGGKTLVDLATETLGEKPAFWGRYFTSAASTGVVEYRHLKEGQLLREKDIRVLPIARQTKRVHGTTAQGTVDAKLNAKDVLLTFGTDYLKSLGGKFLMFLDVESTPPLSLAYYKGWATTLSDYSQTDLRAM